MGTDLSDLVNEHGLVSWSARSNSSYHLEMQVSLVKSRSHKFIRVQSSNYPIFMDSLDIFRQKTTDMGQTGNL